MPAASESNRSPDKMSIHRIEDIRPAAEALRDAVFALTGLQVAACANIASKEPMVDADGAILAAEVFGWTEPGRRWWENSRLALTSPIPIACRYESEPFWCNSKGIHTRQPNPLLAKIDLSDFNERAMTGAAIVIPIHLPFGQIAAVSYQPYGGESTDLSSEFEAHGYVLDLWARTFVCSYVKLMTERKWIMPDCRLSKREVECLSWAAVGKTDHEIAMILSRSCATVRFHIHNAAIKLGAVNRSQTLFKAAQLGYLGSVAESPSCATRH